MTNDEIDELISDCLDDLFTHDRKREDFKKMYGDEAVRIYLDCMLDVLVEIAKRLPEPKQ